MNQQTAVTVIAARFDHALTKGEDTSAPPAGAALSTGGTEVTWESEDGFARRDRYVRIWMAIWPDVPEARAFFAAREDHIPLLKTATENVALLAVPFACHGALNWSHDGQAQSLYPHLSKRPGTDGPVLVMTSLGIGDPSEGLVAFGQGVTAVRAAFAENPAVLMDANMLPDIPMIDGPTLTLWRSEQEMMQSAYRTDPHKSAMQMRNGAMARASFTRMTPLFAEGIWQGVNLAEAIAPHV